MSLDSSPGRFPKKYLGSVNKSSHSSSQRSSNAKSLTTGSKISAPKPLNLPSLRHESSKASPDSTCSTSGESDHHPTSTIHTPNTINRWGSPLLQQHSSASGLSDSDTKSKDSISSTSPTIHQSSPSASPAWSTISSSTKKATDTTASAITTIPSPPSESTTKSTVLSPKKDHVKVTVSHHAKAADIPMPFTQASEPSNMSWDEMVSEEMDFNVAVVDEDDNDIKLEDQESTSTSLEDTDGNTTLSENQSLHQQPVSPSDRFTDDYDRSYPSTSKRTSPGSLYNSQSQEPYRHQDRYHHHHHHHHYHDSYHNNNNNAAAQNGGKWSSERRGSEHSNTSGYRGQRRPSSSSHSATGTGWNSHNDQQRRISQDRPKPLTSPQLHQYPDASSITTATTTLLRRPSTNNNNSVNNSNNALYSTSDDRPPEIVAAQRQAMLSAAEQAKKRREADEAERQAAVARARQKALALAPPPPLSPAIKSFETTPPPSPDNHISEATASTPAITILTHAHEDHLKTSDNSKTRPSNSTDGAATNTDKNQKATLAPVVKKGTLITTTTASTSARHLFANKPPAPLTEDEKSWEIYVDQLKNPDSTVGNKDGEDESTTVSDWSSFAHRLQRSTEEKKARKTMDAPTKEDSLADQKQLPSKPTKDTPIDESTLKSSSPDQSLLQDIPESKATTAVTATTTIQTATPAPSVKEVPTSTAEAHLLKPRRFIKPKAILDKAAYPIFTDSISRFVLPKPTTLQFMIDPDESDDELLYTLERHYHHQFNSSPAKQTKDTSSTPFIESKTSMNQVKSSSSPPLPDAQVTISRQYNTENKRTPVVDEVSSASHQTTHEKKESSLSTYDDTLYPEGLPVPSDLFSSTVSPASMTHASIHTTLSNFNVTSGYDKVAPHNEHYPILMYPLHAPTTDIMTMTSDQKNQPGFSVVLLPPSDAHSTSKSGSSHRHGPRKGYGRLRGAGGRGGKHRHHHPSSSTNSWRSAGTASGPTKADRPTAKTA